MSQPPITKDAVFSDFRLNPNLLSALNQLGITHPTPIQLKTIPHALSGRDIIGIAQTGTGKTLAFTLPLLHQIISTKKRALIILPTRELALQVEEVIKKIAHSSRVSSAVIIGGQPISFQIRSLRRQPQIIVGTPGRINDHLQNKTITLNKISILVLDEADRMLDMGFAPQINRILEHVPKQRQTMLFSATMPPEIARITSEYMNRPERIEIARAGTVATGVHQELFFVRSEQKGVLLHNLLNTHDGTTLVFSRTKYGAKRICKNICNLGHAAAEIHSNLSLSQRRRSLQGFKNGIYKVLVATDIAARGIDVADIGLVINYDLPDNLDDYIHRIGRTGRAGKNGRAVSFATPDQRGKIRIIERLIRQPLRISPLPHLPKQIHSQPSLANPVQATASFRPSAKPRRRQWQNNRTPSRRQARIH